MIGYLVAMGYGQLQSVGDIMGYVQGISKQKLLEAETEHSLKKANKILPPISTPVKLAK